MTHTARRRHASWIIPALLISTLAALPAWAQPRKPKAVTPAADWRAQWRKDRNRLIQADPRLERDPTSVLVQFSNTANPADVDLITSLAKLRPIAGFDLVPGLKHLALPVGGSVEETIRVVESLDQALKGPVDFVEPDLIAHTTITPGDPSYPSLWGMNNTGQTVRGVAGLADADINAPQAWDIFRGDQAFLIAVCDTGLRRTHQDLAPNIAINRGEIPGDGIDNDADGYVDNVWGWDFYNNDADPADDNNHGSHVAGTIGARGDNGKGVAGVNWNCGLVSLKIGSAQGSIPLSAAIASLDYCVKENIRLSNHSWGGGGFHQATFNAIARARAAGHLIIAAAGNFGSNNDATPFYPASYNLDNIISVAALDNRGARASFSNYGASSVDIAAPGVGILSCVRSSDASYASMNGTSMAAPHVTGVAALVWARNPSWTYAQVRDRVLGTGRPVPAMAGRCITGACVDALDALRGKNSSVLPPRP